jgi:tetratricopeptide (TPR) repeat protein
MNKIRSLFLAANPHYTERLSLDKEMREITEKVRASEYRDALELIAAWAVRSDDLLQNLNRYKPQIVHFSGHGSPTGEIILVDQNDAPKSVSADALKALFTTLRDNVRLVILNACYSKIQAQSITQVIDCAIGMNASIGDRAAITFIASVYRAIGFGRSIKEAFEQGRVALTLDGISEEQTPELLCKYGIDPASIILIEESKNTDEYNHFLQQGIKLLQAKLYEQAIIKFEQVIQLDSNNINAHFYLAIAKMTDRSFNALYPKERTLIEKHLRTAYTQSPNWLLPAILLGALEIDYYNAHGVSSSFDISVRKVNEELRNFTLTQDEVALLKTIKVSREAKQQLGLKD